MAAKGRNNVFYRNGNMSGYTEYRYGEECQKKKSRPIYNPAKREHMVGAVRKVLEDWEFSAFEHEAACRHGLRQGFCMEGYSWQRSDDEAAFIVGEGLRSLGAKRPSFVEGQWNYTTPPENCAWCGREIDDPDATPRQRFCSVECAKAALVRRERKQREENDLVMQAAYNLIKRKTSLPKPCATCGKPFQAARIRTIYCSMSCAAIGRHVAAGHVNAEVTCGWCETVFHPRQKGRLYCSKSCSKKATLAALMAREPDRVCACCGLSFRAHSVQQLYCSESCAREIEYLVDRIARGKAALTPLAFDYLARTAPPMHLTPARFDRMLMAA